MIVRKRADTVRRWATATGQHVLALVVALGAALGAGWCLYQNEQRDRLDRLLTSLFFDTAYNQSILRGVVEGQWREDSIDVRIPSPSVAEALVSDPSVFASELDYETLLAIVQYHAMLLAAQRTMEFMQDRFADTGTLSNANLETLDRKCRASLAATYLLQRRVSKELQRRGLALHRSEPVGALARDLKNELDRVKREVQRPTESKRVVPEEHHEGTN